MTHTLAMEWASHNIRVNSVSPGLVNTAMTYWVPQQPDWEQQLKYYGGMPRLAEVQELGGAYVCEYHPYSQHQEPSYGMESRAKY